jgi:lactoylglutathione lyase/methylmalonyl-CoA/ethylmalonyl-CoA epimerase
MLHHVGIVVRDEAQMERFVQLLGLTEVRREHLPKYRVTNVFYSPGEGPQIQFMLPDGGILANYNQGRGGLHHIAFWAPDITPVQRDLEARGLRFIAREKQQGIGHFKFNFVLPNVEGVSVELIEDPDFGWPPAR